MGALPFELPDGTHGADASVVLCARLRRHVVVTSDRDDLLRFDPGLRVVVV